MSQLYLQSLRNQCITTISALLEYTRGRGIPFQNFRNPTLSGKAQQDPGTSQEDAVEQYMTILLGRWTQVHQDKWYFTQPANIHDVVLQEIADMKVFQDETRALLDERIEKQLWAAHMNAWKVLMAYTEAELTAWWQSDWTLTPAFHVDGEPLDEDEQKAGYASLKGGQYHDRKDAEFTIDALFGVNRGGDNHRDRVFTIGDTLLLDPGQHMRPKIAYNYEGFTLGQETPWTNIFAREVGGTVIIREKSESGTMFADDWRNFPLRIHNITFKPVYSNGGVDHTLYSTANPVTWGYEEHHGLAPIEFSQCVFDGGWSAETNTGTEVKQGWIVYGPYWPWNNTMAGIKLNKCTVQGVRSEHGMYMHNTFAGENDDHDNKRDWNYFLAKDCTFKWVKRTAAQWTNRDDGRAEGPTPGYGNSTWDGCRFEDCDLESSNTGVFGIKGGLDGIITVKNCIFRQGMNPNIHPDLHSRLGHGCFSITLGSSVNDRFTNKIVIDGCDIEMGPFRPDVDEGIIIVRDGSGAIIVDELELTNTRIYQHETPFGFREAIQFQNNSFNHLTISRNNEVNGYCKWGDTTYASYADFIAYLETLPNVDVV